MTKLPVFVRSLVARQVTSATRPSWAPTATQWPMLNGFSLWIASPAKALPRVSCSAKPITTALTAEVVRILSPKAKVAISMRMPMTIAS